MADDRAVSKRLSYWLRHRPDAAGLTLDLQGWARVERVLIALDRAGLPASPAALQNVVEGNDKQRFELSADGGNIRARQGHSVSVDLGWRQAEPPEHLYHGTVGRSLDAILAEGLRPMARHHVHLSPDQGTARQVGGRRGEPLILLVAAGRMAFAGHAFYLTANDVWLTDAVPPLYLGVLGPAARG